MQALFTITASSENAGKANAPFCLHETQKIYYDSLTKKEVHKAS
jgi:hypothetical protein